jgi:hypothetical protein
MYLINPLDKKVLETPLPSPNNSPNKEKEKENGKNGKSAAEVEAATRQLLVKWTGLHNARTALLSLAFGSAVCGVLLVNRKSA